MNKCSKYYIFFLGLSEEELLIRAREERATIVGRYHLGREDGAVIVPWEDPEYEIYHATDRYGFIQFSFSFFFFFSH